MNFILKIDSEKLFFGLYLIGGRIYFKLVLRWGQYLDNGCTTYKDRNYWHNLSFPLLVHYNSFHQIWVKDLYMSDYEFEIHLHMKQYNLQNFPKMSNRRPLRGIGKKYYQIL